jgi:hypothetical protein
MYDYYLGGKNHFAADREAADKALSSWPAGRIGRRENRKFLGRAVRYLAKDAGIRQFLDIGSGLPATNNVHEVAQAVAPRPASSTWTTTPWCSRTRGPCSWGPARAAPPTSTTTSAIPAQSWTRRRSSWTSRS